MDEVKKMDDKEMKSEKSFAEEMATKKYEDGGVPIVKHTGELLGLIPRAIKAALAPLEKWVLQKEYNIEETKKLLEEKLKNVSPDLIESPDAHVAVPALQYISYCMDNEELRNMYANLLANSMNKVVKNGVHPGFVEIIKQLCPDEAKILRYLSTHYTIPTVTLRYEEDKGGGGINIITNFSNIGEICHCENPYDINKYFNNLVRLGLLEASQALSTLTDKNLYKPLEEHFYIQARMNESVIKKAGYDKSTFIEGFMMLTDYGKAFCSICVNDIKTTTGVVVIK